MTTFDEGSVYREAPWWPLYDRRPRYLTPPSGFYGTCVASVGGFASVAAGGTGPLRVYYVVYPSALAAPTSAQVVAGHDSTNSAAAASGYEAAPAVSGVLSFASVASGLTKSTSYRIAYVLDAGYASGPVVVSDPFTTLDNPTPITGTGDGALGGFNHASSGALAFTGTGAHALSGLATLATGLVLAPRLYYVIYHWTLPDPSAARVIAGENANGGAASASGSELAPLATGAYSFSAIATGLSSSTSYRIAFVMYDGQSFSNVVVSSPFQTLTSITGTGHATLHGLNTAGIAVEGLSGTATGSIGAPAASGAGTLAFIGVSAGALAGIGSDASGALAFSGSAVSALAGFKSFALETVTRTGDAEASLGGVGAAGSGSIAFTGTGTSTLGGLASLLYGEPPIEGTATCSIGGMTTAVNALLQFIGTGSGALTLTTSGSLVMSITGTAAAKVGGLAGLGRYIPPAPITAVSWLQHAVRDTSDLT